MSLFTFELHFNLDSSSYALSPPCFFPTSRDEFPQYTTQRLYCFLAGSVSSPSLKVSLLLGTSPTYTVQEHPFPSRSPSNVSLLQSLRSSTSWNINLILTLEIRPSERSAHTPSHTHTSPPPITSSRSIVLNSFPHYNSLN